MFSSGAQKNNFIFRITLSFTSMELELTWIYLKSSSYLSTPCNFIEKNYFYHHACFLRNISMTLLFLLKVTNPKGCKKNWYLKIHLELFVFILLCKTTLAEIKVRLHKLKMHDSKHLLSQLHVFYAEQKDLAISTRTIFMSSYKWLEVWHTSSWINCT